VLLLLLLLLLLLTWQVYAGAFLGVLFGMFYPMPIVVTA
jgi:hypothetical protein